jgi:hypothetical protein
MIVLKWISFPKMLPRDGHYMLWRESAEGEQSSAQRAHWLELLDQPSWREFASGAWSVATENEL